MAVIPAVHAALSSNCAVPRHGMTTIFTPLHLQAQPETRQAYTAFCRSISFGATTIHPKTAPPILPDPLITSVHLPTL
jgi:hypothetical protein